MRGDWLTTAISTGWALNRYLLLMLVLLVTPCRIALAEELIVGARARAPEVGPAKLAERNPEEELARALAPRPETVSFEVSVSLPDCDASDPTVHMIRKDADWGAINDPALRVFCVHPGDYRALGRIELRVSGSKAAPRVVRYYDPEEPTRLVHPVHMGASAQARVEKIRILKANYWIVDGIAFPNEDPDPSLLNRTVELVSASFIHLQDLLVEGGRVGVTILRHSSFNVLQGSVVRDTVLVKGDSNCITISPGPHNDIEMTGNRIVSNEAYDCTDSLQLHINGGSEGSTFPGTVIANNDFYLTPARYTDCKGKPDPEGPCAAAEGRLDLKGGGTGPEPERRVNVIGNRIWGTRKTDASGIGGGGSWGTALESCCHPSKYLLVEKNIIFNVARGIGSSETTRSTYRDNVIYDVYSPYDGQGNAFYGAGDKVEFYRNTVISAVSWAGITGSDNDVRCNVFISASRTEQVPRGAARLEMDYNAWYATPPPGDLAKNDIAFDSEEAAQQEELCFVRTTITKPEMVCIPHGRTTARSPHADLCDASLGLRAGVGIDDKPYP